MLRPPATIARTQRPCCGSVGQRVGLAGREEAAPMSQQRDTLSFQSSRHLLGLTGLECLLLEEVASGSASDAFWVTGMFLLGTVRETAGTKPLLHDCTLFSSEAPRRTGESIRYLQKG